MKRFRCLGIALGLWLAGSAASASAATNIDCMSSGYGKDEDSYYRDFVSSFDPQIWGKGDQSESMLLFLTQSASRCADLNDWSPDAIESAIFFRMGSLLAEGIESKSPLSAIQMGRLKKAVEAADQVRLTRIFGGILSQAIGQEKAPEPTRDDKMFLGMLIVRAGVPITQANSEFAGAWIAARVMRESAKAKFEKN